MNFSVFCKYQQDTQPVKNSEFLCIHHKISLRHTLVLNSPRSFDKEQARLYQPTRTHNLFLSCSLETMPQLATNDIEVMELFQLSTQSKLELAARQQPLSSLLLFFIILLSAISCKLHQGNLQGVSCDRFLGRTHTLRTSGLRWPSTHVCTSNF